MRECYNSKINISNNSLLSICLLIILVTLLLVHTYIYTYIYIYTHTHTHTHTHTTVGSVIYMDTMTRRLIGILWVFRTSLILFVNGMHNSHLLFLYVIWMTRKIYKILNFLATGIPKECITTNIFSKYHKEECACLNRGRSQKTWNFYIFN